MLYAGLGKLLSNHVAVKNRSKCRHNVTRLLYILAQSLTFFSIVSRSKRLHFFLFFTATWLLNNLPSPTYLCHSNEPLPNYCVRLLAKPFGSLCPAPNNAWTLLCDPQQVYMYVASAYSQPRSESVSMPWAHALLIQWGRPGYARCTVYYIYCMMTSYIKGQGMQGALYIIYTNMKP